MVACARAPEFARSLLVALPPPPPHAPVRNIVACLMTLDEQMSPGRVRTDGKNCVRRGARCIWLVCAIFMGMLLSRMGPYANLKSGRTVDFWNDDGGLQCSRCVCVLFSSSA